jgi:hypothetical protein
MNLQEFRKNRARFSYDELAIHQGKWIAFSMDGRTIIASSENLATLDALIVAAGADPEETALERIEFDSCSFGGAEAN